MKIIKAEWSSNEEIPKWADCLRLNKIKVNSIKSFSDCTCIENITFKFNPSDIKGAIPGFAPDFILNFEIETGYRPSKDVRNELYEYLRTINYTIINIDDLMLSFNLRHYFYEED